MLVMCSSQQPQTLFVDHTSILCGLSLWSVRLFWRFNVSILATYHSHLYYWLPTESYMFGIIRIEDPEMFTARMALPQINLLHYKMNRKSVL